MDKSDYDQFLENEMLIIHVVVFLAYKIKLFQKLNDGQSLTMAIDLHTKVRQRL